MARKKFEITPEQIQDFRNATLMDDVFMKPARKLATSVVRGIAPSLLDKY